MLRAVLGRRAFHSSEISRAKKAASAEFNAESTSQRLGLTFTTPDILQRALTHKSFNHGQTPSNERLQYLGNRVLGLFITESAFKSNTGNLQQHVSEQINADNLAAKFDALNLEPGLQYHLRNGVTAKVKADAFKAVVGAVYHDQGFSAAREFVQKHL